MAQVQIPPRPDPNPRWALENYEGSEADLAEWLYRSAFWRQWNGKEQTLDTTSALARAIADAKLKSLERTFDLADVVARARIKILWDFKKNGWAHYLGGEYESIGEVLSMIRDHYDPDADQIGQLDFLINEFLPAAEKQGLPAELFTRLPDKYNKAIEAVPRLRQILARGDVTEAKEIIEHVVDESSVQSIRDWLAGRTQQPLEKVTLYRYVEPDGAELIVLRLPTSAHFRFLEVALRKILAGEEIHASIKLMQELSTKLLGKRDDDQ